MVGDGPQQAAPLPASSRACCASSARTSSERERRASAPRRECDASLMGAERGPCSRWTPQELVTSLPPTPRARTPAQGTHLNRIHIKRQAAGPRPHPPLPAIQSKALASLNACCLHPRAADASQPCAHSPPSSYLPSSVSVFTGMLCPTHVLIKCACMQVHLQHTSASPPQARAVRRSTISITDHALTVDCHRLRRSRAHRHRSSARARSPSPALRKRQSSSPPPTQAPPRSLRRP